VFEDRDRPLGSEEKSGAGVAKGAFGGIARRGEAKVGRANEDISGLAGRDGVVSDPESS
jgi:hypothetical protein